MRPTLPEPMRTLRFIYGLFRFFHVTSSPDEARFVFMNFTTRRHGRRKKNWPIRFEIKAIIINSWSVSNCAVSKKQRPRRKKGQMRPTKTAVRAFGFLFISFRPVWGISNHLHLFNNPRAVRPTVYLVRKFRFSARGPLFRTMPWNDGARAQ